MDQVQTEVAALELTEFTPGSVDLDRQLAPKDLGPILVEHPCLVEDQVGGAVETVHPTAAVHARPVLVRADITSARLWRPASGRSGG